MKIFVSLFFLIYSGFAFGQTSVIGGGVGAGTSSMGVLSGTYAAYTGQGPVQPPAIPDMGGLTNNGAQVTDSSYVSGTPATVMRCTDANSNPGAANLSFSAGIGSSGDGVAFDTSDSLIHVNTTGGAGYILLMQSSTGVCNTKVITKDLNLTNPGPANQAFGFGGGGFSITNPGKWFSINGDLTISAYTINPSTGQFTVATIADLKKGLPGNSGPANAPAWAPNTFYPYGSYVTFTLTTGLATWKAANAYVAGDLISPVAGCALKVTKAGTTGGVAPSWTATCNSSFGTVVDNTVTWRRIGPPTFVFQNTSGNGTSGSGSGPFFGGVGPVQFLDGVGTGQMPGGHPDMLSTVADNGITWTNVGVDIVPSSSSWDSFGGTGANDQFITAAVSTNSYGNPTDPLANPQGYGNWNADQGTGIYVIQADLSAGVYHLLNTATGIVSDNDGSGHWTHLGLATATDCRFYIHNVKGPYGDREVIAYQYKVAANSCPDLELVWRPTQTPFVAATQLQNAINGNHWALQKDHVIDVGSGGYGATLGVYAIQNSLSTPVVSAPAVIVANPCTPNGSGSYSTPNCFGPAAVDSHVGCTYNPNLSDKFPCAGTMFNIVTVSPVEVQAWDGEEIAITTTPTDSNPGSAPIGTVSRFAHANLTGSNPDFSAQFGISQFSQTGNYLAWTSDWNGTLGSTTGIAPTVANGQLAVAPPAAYTCLGAPVWQKSTVYAGGTLIGPIGATGGSTAPFHIFQAIIAGTSGTTQPAGFPGSTLGSTFTDGTAPNQITWKDLGPGNCRGDVFVAKLPLVTSPAGAVVTIQ